MATAMRVRVHKGFSGMRPVMGAPTEDNLQLLKQIYHQGPDTLDTLTIKPRDIFTKRVISLKLPPSNGPADIEYQRNKLGFIMPREKETLESLSLATVLNNIEATGQRRIGLMKPLPEDGPSMTSLAKEWIERAFLGVARLDPHEQSKLKRDKKLAKQKRNLEFRLSIIEQKRLKLILSLRELEGSNRSSVVRSAKAQTHELLSRIKRQSLQEKKIGDVQALRKYSDHRQERARELSNLDDIAARTLREKLEWEKRVSREKIIHEQMRKRTAHKGSADSLELIPRHRREKLRQESREKDKEFHEDLDRVSRFIHDVKYL